LACGETYGLKFSRGFTQKEYIAVKRLSARFMADTDPAYRRVYA